MESAVLYAQQKVESVIKTIDSVKELDFPYDHPLEAVNNIRSAFEGLKKHLNDISDPITARKVCKQVSEAIDNLLFAIGFMVRACDVRGALELQGPLLRLTRKAMGSHAKLVVSSEWQFSPFTLLYPGEFGDGLDEFVLVGLPAAEAGNPLIAPLAGHELGHNIWRRLGNLKECVEDLIDDRVMSIIKNEVWEEFSNLFRLSNKKQLGQKDLFGNPAQLAKVWAVSQCEEMFCDFIGLCIFGEGYLHAFQYLISPGGGFRNPVYPSMQDRVAALVKASTILGVTVPPTFREEFDESDVSSDPAHQLLLKISDDASKDLVENLSRIAKNFCEQKVIINRDTGDVDRIFSSFKKVAPVTGAKSLANIVNAAWRIFLDPVNYWEDDYPVTAQKPEKRIELIRELALKSFEVFEIERIQQES